MKKVLLAGTALLGLAVLATPAQADIDIKVGGYFAGYGIFTDNDEPAGVSLREFNLRRDNELYFSGETTLDNGLTVGAHTELQLGGNDSSASFNRYVDETYAYFSGNWGRVNIGAEDGAAYLLQVEAPSADTNIDGLRQYITALNPGNTATATTPFVLDYDHADFRQVDRLTYLTPKFSGFQAGLSYAPEAFFNGTNGGNNPAKSDQKADTYEDLVEVAARWDGAFSGFGIGVGAGYSHASLEVNAPGDDSLKTWNVGLNLTWSAFSLGGAYLTTNNGLSGSNDSDTWVVGAAWDNGPYHVGVSYLDLTDETGGADVDTHRLTLGGGYTFGPGMTFRGSVAFGEVDAPGGDVDFTQVAIGTDIQF